MTTPGPIDPSVLTLQATHRSVSAWEGIDRLLITRQHYWVHWVVPERVMEYVEECGFGGIHRLLDGGLDTNRALITALVERWRQETHTFHLTVGEATITLQDVGVLLGLPVDGTAVIGRGDGAWAAIVLELLGVLPQNPENPAETQILIGSSLRLTWLRDHFSEGPPDDADEETIQRHARAYILYLMGCILFADKSGDCVQLIYLPLLSNLDEVSGYSWGSATLAYLYRQLCRASRKGAKEIGGCLLLLQIWSWEHILIGRPDIRSVRPVDDDDHEDNGGGFEPVLGTQHRRGRDPLAVSWLRVHLSRSHAPRSLVYYRDSFDRQRDDQMVWQPYTTAKLDALPDICIAGQGIWRSRCPLICFDVVEFHLPDRVMRQFGMEQHIPQACDTGVDLHKIDRRTGDKNFLHRHRSHVDAWRDRASSLVQGDNYTGQTLGDYMTWYRRITRLRITNPTSAQSASHHHPTATILAERMRGVLLECSSTIHGASVLPADMGYQLCTQTLGSISTSLTEVLGQTGYSYLIPTPPANDEMTQTPPGSTRSRRQRGSSSTRSSRGRSRGLGRSISTPSHSSPPIQVPEYRHRTPTLDDIPEVDESTPTSSIGSKRGRGL